MSAVAGRVVEGPGVALGAGVGLRVPHLDAAAAIRPASCWFEVHAENYMGGGPALRALLALRRDHPIALHGVGLSLGSAGDLDERHLGRLAALAERIDPVFVSEHLAWSALSGTYLNHLLPLPWSLETLDTLCRHVDQVQERLRRRLLVENPSSYLRFREAELSEPELLGELVRRTGCAVLCDVNNAYVSGQNLGFDPSAYLAELPVASVAEIHLAGHAVNEVDGVALLIDDHGSRVKDAVWALYAEAIGRFGPVPTIVEWDTALPGFEVLLDEARRADAVAAAQTAGVRDVRAA